MIALQTNFIISKKTQNDRSIWSLKQMKNKDLVEIYEYQQILEIFVDSLSTEICKIMTDLPLMPAINGKSVHK